ncbi:MAG: class I SAM-dependent methyltransferase [Sulfuriferula sp.]
MTNPDASLAEWFTSPLGQYLVTRELAYFDQTVIDLFGFNALQVGLSHMDLLRNSRISHRFRVDNIAIGDVVAEATHLPFAAQSIDLLVLPHLLEFSPYPHQILREAERVLIAEGNLLISGFNPRSLWGLYSWTKQRSDKFPWQGDFVNFSRLKDWLSLLGCDIVGWRMCCYAPPFAHIPWVHRFEFMEAAGDRWWAMGGGVYFIHAVKRVHGMRLITPRWQSKNKLVNALRPVTRGMQNERRSDHE